MMLNKELKCLLGIKLVLEQLYHNWSDAAFDEFCFSAEEYLGIGFENYNDVDLAIKRWQITVNIIYHIVSADWLIYNEEPENIKSLSKHERIKYRLKYVKEKLAKFNPNPNIDDNSYVWKYYFDSTTECDEFMALCDDESEELADKKFIHNLIEYFNIKDIKSWLEEPIITVG